MVEHSLQGKAVMLTGAAGGFGRLLGAAFTAQGACVTAMDIDAAGLAALRESLPADQHDRMLTPPGDIADYAACEAAVARTKERFGGVHILINNAAMGMRAVRTDFMQRVGGIDEIAPELWQRFVAVNLSGAWNMTRAVFPHMREQAWGRIIDITTSFRSMLRAGFHPYGPTKAGLEAMAAGHAVEFAGTGITVNVVIPGGAADTPMMPPESGFAREDLIPPGVMVPPILWLCSSAADGLTGNRYIARNWDAELAPETTEQQCRAPIAWPDLTTNFVEPMAKKAH